MKEYNSDPIKNYYEREEGHFESNDIDKNKDIKNESYEVWKEKIDFRNKNLDEKELEFTKKFAFYFLAFFVILFIVSILSVVYVVNTMNEIVKSEETRQEVQVDVEEEQTIVVDISD